MLSCTQTLFILRMKASTLRFNSSASSSVDFSRTCPVGCSALGDFWGRREGAGEAEVFVAKRNAMMRLKKQKTENASGEKEKRGMESIPDSSMITERERETEEGR